MDDNNNDKCDAEEESDEVLYAIVDDTDFENECEQTRLHTHIVGDITLHTTSDVFCDIEWLPCEPHQNQTLNV